MMNRYQILIEYDGSNFLGWQIQKKGNSIQKKIQDTLSKLLKERIIVQGAGRTDRAVSYTHLTLPTNREV